MNMKSQEKVKSLPWVLALEQLLHTASVPHTLPPTRRFLPWPLVISMGTPLPPPPPQDKGWHCAGRIMCPHFHTLKASLINPAWERAQIWEQESRSRKDTRVVLWKLCSWPITVDESAGLDQWDGLKRSLMMEINKDTLFWQHDNWR